MVQATFAAATVLEPYTALTAFYTGSSAANAQAWYLYNERND